MKKVIAAFSATRDYKNTTFSDISIAIRGKYDPI